MSINQKKNGAILSPAPIGKSKNYRKILDGLLEGIYILDFEWRYIYVNHTMLKQRGMPIDKFMGHTMMEVYPGIEDSSYFKALQLCMNSRKPASLEIEWENPEGTKNWYEINLSPVDEGVMVMSLDISNRKTSEEKIQKANRLYTVISQVNQNIVRVKEKNALFRNACSIAIEFGKFEIAWIGLFDKENTAIHLEEQCGIKAAALKNFIEKPFLTDDPQNAILRGGKHYISNNLLKSIALESWQPFAKKYNVNSMMVLPIKKKSGKVIGSFNLYAREINFFDREEIALLIEVADDISFALNLFEQAKKNSETEILLAQNEKRYRALIEKGGDMKTLSTPEGKHVYASPSITKILGYTLKEFLTKTVYDIIHPDELTVFELERATTLKTAGKTTYLQHRFLHKNGGWVWCEGSITNMLKEPGIEALVSNFRDITDKRNASEQKEFDTSNLQALINNTNDFMWSIDKNYNLIAFNKPFQDIVERMQDAPLVKGSNALELEFFEEHLVRFKKYFERAFNGEIFKEIEHTTDGVEIWSEISFYPIKNGGEIVGSACQARDITEKIKAEKELIKREVFNRGVLDSLSSHISVINSSGEIVAVNEAWRRFAKENNGNALLCKGVGGNYFEVCQKSASEGEAIADDVLKGMKEVMNENRADYYLEYPSHSTFEQHWFALHVLKFESDEKLLVAAHIDITERKLAEEKLIINNDELLKANKELDRFVYSVSHDIRSPLTSVMGLITFIEDESNQPDILTYAGMMRSSINRLEDFINNILSYSRNNRIELEVENIPLTKTVNEIWASLCNIKEAKGILFEVDIDELHTFYSDKQRFSTIVENLISNAIKYHKKDVDGRYIKVIGTSGIRQLNFRVEDNGIGIASKHYNKIFDMFFRISAKAPGSGIGLYIVKEIIEKLRGTINVNSEEGIGTAFNISLKNNLPK